MLNFIQSVVGQKVSGADEEARYLEAKRTLSNEYILSQQRFMRDLQSDMGGHVNRSYFGSPIPLVLVGQPSVRSF
jgi:hypothetical protein